jgi:uncharacterized protein YjiS (DUF1127 family)
MSTLIMRPACHGSQLHQKNSGAQLLPRWRRWRLRSARHSQRKALRDLADDPHLLRDIGVTRDQALKEAGRSIFDLTDIHIHST